MPSKASEFALSFPLDLGIDNTAHPSAVQPVGPAAALVSSVNTRLSKQRGVPRKAPLVETLEDPSPGSHYGTAACGGIIPYGNLSSCLVMRMPGYGCERINTQRVGGYADLSQLQSPLHPSGADDRQFWSADVSRAGVVPTPGQGTPHAMCALDGYLWFASIRLDQGNPWLFVTVIGPDDEIDVLPQGIVQLTGTITTPPWVGLTAHGANGVVVWYRNGTGAAILARTLTLAANGRVTASGASTIYTPVSAGNATYDVCALDNDTAYLATNASTGPADMALLRVDIATLTVTDSDVQAAVGAGTTSRYAVSAKALLVGTRIVVTHLRATGVADGYLYEDTGSLALLNAATLGSPSDPSGDPLAGFWASENLEHAVFGLSHPTASLSATAFTGTAGTYLEFADITSGAVVANTRLAWARALSRLVMHSPSDGEMFPLLCVQTVWSNLSSASPTNAAFLTDPDVRVMRVDTVGTTPVVSTVGRFGVDTAAIYPTGGVSVIYNSQIACIEGDKLAFNYFERQVDFDVAYAANAYAATARYVEMDFRARQPNFALGADGVAIIAGALPMEWDGGCCSELCVPVRPKVAVATSGGGGINVPAGTYLVSAVQQWVDAAGVLHRSMPADVVSVTMPGATSWVIYVSVPPAIVRDGVNYDAYETIIYISQLGGTVLYRQYATVSSFNSYVQTFNGSTFTLTAGDATHPPIYTTGDPVEELMAQHPPAMKDVEIIAERGWMIEAERPRRLWYSKPKVNGISYEWSSDQTIELPPRAGKALRVVDIGGSVAALCTGGVWIVTGQGPDPALVSGAFNPPEQISDIACTDANSVIRTPAGVLFASSDRFAMIGSAGARVFDQVQTNTSSDVVPILLRKQYEVAWLSRAGNHVVYNYQLDRWSTWDIGAIPAVACAALDPVSGLVFLANGSYAAQVVDPQLSSLTAQVSFETGDVVFGGPEDDNVVNEVVLRAQYGGEHGVTFTLTPDYGQAPGSPFVRSFSAAEVLACTVNDQYTLSVSPGSMAMRSLKVAIAETGAEGDGLLPLSLTIQGARNGGTMRSAVRAQGRK